MKAYIMSDIHVDTHFTYANEPSLLREDDPCEEVTFATMDWLWKFHDIPETEALIIPGDMSNDFLTFTREIQWLSKKYKEVFFTPGNHDMMVRGGTPSKSNLVFKTTEEKIAKLEEIINAEPEVDTTPSADERIAAALEAQVMMSLPDETEDTTNA